MPLLTVVIPTFNRRIILVRAIRSVLAQPFQDMEVMVVDDGSTDGTMELASAFSDPRLKWIHQPNAGVSAARNKGVAVSTGDYLIFLDSDDEFLPDFLVEFERNLNSSPDIIFFSAEIKTENQTGRIIRASAPYDKPSDDGLFLAGTFAVKRSIFERSGGYDENLSYGENTELSFRLNPYSPKRVFINQPLLRINQGSVRESVSPEKIRASIGHMLTKHQAYLSRHPHILFLYLSNIGVACLRLGLVAAARNYFFKAWKVRPLYWKALFRLMLSFSFKRIRRYFYPPSKGLRLT